MKKTLLFIAGFILSCAVVFSFDYDKVEIRKIHENFYIHVSYMEFNGKPFPANGLAVFSSDECLLVDTPWNDTQTENLVKKLENEFHKKVTLVIVSHHHTDNLGGINYLKKKGIKVISTPLTKQIAREKGYRIDYPVIDRDIWEYTFNKTELEVYFPGPAHTIDNIVVWFPKSHILFGGCLIKAVSARNLGNIQDADVKNWPNAVRNVIRRYPSVRIVVPGHMGHGGKELLEHTLKLALEH